MRPCLLWPMSTMVGKRQMPAMISGSECDDFSCMLFRCRSPDVLVSFSLEIIVVDLFNVPNRRRCR